MTPWYIDPETLWDRVCRAAQYEPKRIRSLLEELSRDLDKHVEEEVRRFRVEGARLPKDIHPLLRRSFERALEFAWERLDIVKSGKREVFLVNFEPDGTLKTKGMLQSLLRVSGGSTLLALERIRNSQSNQDAIATLLKAQNDHLEPTTLIMAMGRYWTLLRELHQELLVLQALEVRGLNHQMMELLRLGPGDNAMQALGRWAVEALVGMVAQDHQVSPNDARQRLRELDDWSQLHADLLNILPFWFSPWADDLVQALLPFMQAHLNQQSEVHLVEHIAGAFHASYERQAPDHGYQTRKASSVPWGQMPQHNRELMMAVVADLLVRGVIQVGPAAFAGVGEGVHC